MTATNTLAAMEQVHRKFTPSQPEMKFYLEQPDLDVIPGVKGFIERDNVANPSDSVLFLKYYDPFKPQLRSVPLISTNSY